MKLVLIGAGALARETVVLARACRRAGTLDADPLGYLVDPEHAAAGTVIDGLPVLGGLDWLQGQDLTELRGICAVGAPSLRWRLVERARGYGLRFATLVHPSVLRPTDLVVGEGCMLSTGAILSINLHLGAHVVIQQGTTVAHDAVLADFATLSPGAHLAGRCQVEAGAFVGIGAVVIQGRRLGAWSMVGAGSTVLDDVEPDVTVVGSPARVVARRTSGWHQAPGHEPF